MSLTTLYKYPEETRTYSFDFSNQVEIAGGETLSDGTATVTYISTGDVGLTIGDATVSGTTVLAEISGGVLGTTYVVVAVVDTSGGSTIAAAGKLKIDRT